MEIQGLSFLCKYVLFCHYRNVSTCEVTSSQATSSPQRSKRVKENTPPRCAMVHNSPACSTSVTCGWGDVASSTTRERQRQTIVIPDTPSPTVSVITISSDTDEEEEQKHAPTRWGCACRLWGESRGMHCAVWSWATPWSLIISCWPSPSHFAMFLDPQLFHKSDKQVCHSCSKPK